MRVRWWARAISPSLLWTPSDTMWRFRKSWQPGGRRTSPSRSCRVNNGKSVTRPAASPTPPIMPSSPGFCPHLPRVLVGILAFSPLPSAAAKLPLTRNLCLRCAGYRDRPPPRGVRLPHHFASEESVSSTVRPLWGVFFLVYFDGSPLATGTWVSPITALDGDIRYGFAEERLAALTTRRKARLFLFLNISAMHQPNCGYLPGATEDRLARDTRRRSAIRGYASWRISGPLLQPTRADTGRALF